ncbi:MAG TPA: APC family permease [Candidatus Binatia bacterium]|nr:APC family permease [Candidatus Binatia bacterium]
MAVTHDTRQLSWTLAWAVVFCDIGTSVYYVPGILYGNVGDKTPFFILLTTLGFIPLALKYIEITWRNPEGGGVVTMTTKAFGPMWGCLGGMLIITSYFLTAAISAVSGFHYIASVLHSLDDHIVILACTGLLALAVLNVIGIRESATAALLMAVTAFVVDLLVIAFSVADLSPSQWRRAMTSLSPGAEMPTKSLLVGFSAAWLAFSGLESISQLSPTMRLPLRKTTRWAMFAVIGTMLVSAPLLSLLSINMLTPDFKSTQSERFISQIASISGGFGLQLAVVISASSLLLFAANTAIIGAYHIFLALAKSEFLPRVIALRGVRFNSPHIAIFIATIVPIAVVVATQGELALLGEMYAFGLIGAFVFSSFSLDVIRWRLGRRDLGFWIGTLTTAMLLLAWCVNLVEKELATMFGGTLTIIGMLIAVGVRRSWFVDFLHRIPAIERLQARAYLASEALVDEELRGLVTLADAIELKALYPATTLLALRGETPALIQQGIHLARGKNETALYCVYVEEWPGLFTGDTPHRPNEEGIRTLRAAVQAVRDKNIEVIPIWTVSHNAADAIANAAKALDVDAVLIGQSRRSAFYHMLRGHVVKGLTHKLPRDCHLIIFN